MKKIFLGVIVVLLCSCSHRLYYPTDIAHRTDTVIRERVTHDTVKIELPVIKEKVVTRDTVSHLENDYATSDASVESGFLHHSLATRGKEIIVPVEVQVHDTTIIDRKAEVIYKEVPAQLTWWQQTQMKLFWVFLAVIILYAVFLVLKSKFSILDILKKI